MSGVRPEFRKGEMQERNMNDVLRALFLRLEAVERKLYVELDFSTDTNGDVLGDLSFKAPSWPVKFVGQAQLSDQSNGFYSVGPTIVWKSTNGVVTVGWYQALAISVKYNLRLLVLG